MSVVKTVTTHTFGKADANVERIVTAQTGRAAITHYRLTIRESSAVNRTIVTTRWQLQQLRDALNEIDTLD